VGCLEIQNEQHGSDWRINCVLDEDLHARKSKIPQKCTVAAGLWDNEVRQRERESVIFCHSRRKASHSSGWLSVEYVLIDSCLRVEFFLKTDGGQPRDAETTLFTLANPGSSLHFNTHWSAPPVSALARSGGPGKMSHTPVSRNSNIERCMDRPKSVLGVIRVVA